MSKDGAFQTVKKFVKEYRLRDMKWAFSFDNKDRWHQVRARLEHAALRQPPRVSALRRRRGESRTETAPAPRRHCL